QPRQATARRGRGRRDVDRVGLAASARSQRLPWLLLRRHGCRLQPRRVYIGIPGAIRGPYFGRGPGPGKFSKIARGAPHFSGGLCFSSDGRRLAGSCLHGFAPGNVVVWELEDGRGIRTFRGLRSHVTKVRFSPDGKLLTGLDQDWRVAIWDVAGGRLLHLLEV